MPQARSKPGSFMYSARHTGAAAQDQYDKRIALEKAQRAREEEAGWGSLWSTVGSIVGGAFGGPLGAAAGSYLGSLGTDLAIDSESEKGPERGLFNKSCLLYTSDAADE